MGFAHTPMPCAGLWVCTSLANQRDKKKSQWTWAKTTDTIYMSADKQQIFYYSEESVSHISFKKLLLSRSELSFIVVFWISTNLYINI